MSEILRRAVRAALFDRRTYLQAQWESSATADAALLVAAVLAVVSLGGALLGGFRLTSLVPALLSDVVFGLAEWLFLAVATWFVGSRLFTSPDDYSRRFESVQVMLRMHGLAFLPVLLTLFGGLVATLAYLWHLAAASLGTSVALDTKPWQGGLAVLLGAALLTLLGLLLGAPFAMLRLLF